MTAVLVELEVGVSKACKSVMIRLSDGEKKMQISTFHYTRHVENITKYFLLRGGGGQIKYEIKN